MVFKKIFSEEKAVTPVVGVMLMVVVTVILAAAVSSYAGSMGTQDAAPQATFVTEASLTKDSVTFSHLGGDILTKADLAIEIAYGKPVTSGYVNMTNVTFAPNGEFLRPGDTATLEFTEGVSHDGKRQAEFTGDDISLAVYEGTPFKMTFIDKNSGQTIYSTTVAMNP